jgi:hypothetical protein
LNTVAAARLARPSCSLSTPAFVGMSVSLQAHLLLTHRCAKQRTWR